MTELDSAVSMIRNADTEAIQTLCVEVMARYRLLFPDSEIMFLSLPKNDPAERSRVLDQMTAWLRNG